MLAVLGLMDPLFGDMTLLLVAPIKVVAMWLTDLKIDCFLLLPDRPPWRVEFSLNDMAADL